MLAWLKIFFSQTAWHCLSDKVNPPRKPSIPRTSPWSHPGYHQGSQHRPTHRLSLSEGVKVPGISSTCQVPVSQAGVGVGGGAGRCSLCVWNGWAMTRPLLPPPPALCSPATLKCWPPPSLPCGEGSSRRPAHPPLGDWGGGGRWTLGFDQKGVLRPGDR